MPQHHVLEEFGDNAVDNGWWDGQDDKGRKHAILHVLRRVSKLVERETIKDAHDHGDEEFAVKIRRASPMLPEYSLRQHGRLCPYRRGELVLCAAFRRWSFAPLQLDSLNF